MNLTLLIPIVVAAVLVLGVGIGVFTMMAAKKKKEAVERWARGAYGLWTGGEDCATWTQDRAQNALKNWYGATALVAWDVDGRRYPKTGFETVLPAGGHVQPVLG